jgi:hypothetical protein
VDDVGLHHVRVEGWYEWLILYEGGGTVVGKGGELTGHVPGRRHLEPE